VPLALTSTAWSIRKLGGRRWQLLHRLIYFSALGGVIHYYWLVKSDIRLPLMYGAILLVLMLYRSVIWLRTAPYGRSSLNR
jgi:sulfoxide reductase heme-binding subunit YedZ